MDVRDATNAEQLEALEDRAATYGLLARLFNREIDDALLESLRALPEGSPLPTTGDASRTDLAVDFARLFIVRTAKSSDVPYPFESVYTSIERTTMGDARDAVLASYRREGLDKSGAWNLPEDHIALELEFMQALCQREADALRSGDDTEAQRLSGMQREFLAQHLCAWTPPFFEAMEAKAQTAFYQDLARFAQAFLQDEAAA